MHASFPNGLQVRSSTELRAAGRRLHGLAAPFNVAVPVGAYQERIAPGAFTATLASGRDALALLDHDPTRLLARTGNGTLRLTEDASGLAFELDVPNTTLGADVLAMAEAGLLGGVSVGFRVSKDGETRTATTRTLLALDLVEISIVQAFPAYPTSVQARFRQSADMARVRRALVMAL